jgi:hypothetical protein
VDERVAVDLGRRGEQKAGAVSLRKTERVVRSVRADLEGVQRKPRVVDGRGGRGHVVYELDRLVDLVVPGDVEHLEAEVGAIFDVSDVLERAGIEVVHADDTMAAGEQVVAQVRAEKARAAGYE